MKRNNLERSLNKEEISLLYGIPKSWVWARLGEIVSNNITKGSTPTSYGYSFKNVGIRFIKTENITENGDIENVSDFIDQETNEFLKRSIIKANDILFSIAGTIGRTGIIKKKDLPANTNQALAIIRCFWNYVDNKYVFYFLKSPFIQKQALDSIVGVGRANVSLTNLSNFLLPFSPLSEQHRIVAKIEELFTRLDAGVEALKKIKAQLKRYRQAVLKYAFEGKLTEEWRRTNKDKIEPAFMLLERIKEERRKNAKGKFKELPLLDTSELPNLPESWVWIHIKDLGSGDKYDIVDGPFGSHLKTSDYVENGEIPVISITNIDEGFSSDKLRYISKQKFETIKRSAVTRGDIIVAKIGSSYGKCGYYPDWMPVGVIPANLLKITVSKSVEKSYVYYYLKSKNFKDRLDLITKSTAQPAYNVSSFKLLPLPLSSIAEQHRIVEEIERRFSVADEIERTVDQSLKQAERLRQSILKKAFEGKLVPQDPSDEPAEKLLERIKAEKSRLEAEKKVKIIE